MTLAHNVRQRQLGCDLYLAFVVQEETGLMGGMPIAHAVSPQVVIGVDGTLAFDTPDLQDQQSDIRLGAGPTVKLLDAIRGKGISYVPHWELVERIRDLAQVNDIQLQAEVITGLSTAITPMPFAGLGIQTAALSIPIRYHHSPVETADPSDSTRLVELLSLIVTQPV
jgi:endoglucanase